VNSCDLDEEESQTNTTEKSNSQLPDNRKNSLQAPFQYESIFCHYTGVLIFNSLLKRLHDFVSIGKQIILQWVVVVLLGAKNIEQTKTIDYIKIIARNMFYISLQPFKEEYNNYRDDHVLFRNLIKSSGFVCRNGNKITVFLFPTAKYPPKIRRVVENILEEKINTLNVS